ncbi:ATP synthase F1 subunit gamma [Apibacter adventoris]|uniref:ATP synthase gamma chain n=1 Tax=Apibacter adventoris TaxID=1679466 RepID=A0A2S8AEW2_9FLAO|nr:ATP synthase F1 subunit gamma [Apibacter adventoris]PQL94189.1 ATP synthase F1 subunit gamma [Apibacter adventoris]
MASLKEIRNRIASVNSTTQITSAMKMVSSSKLKKAQDAICKLRPYSKKMQELLSNVSSNLDSEVGGEYVRKNEVNKVLLIVITSNRGLAGAFNSSVVKEVKNLIEIKYKNKQVEILTIGKKGYDILNRSSVIYKDYSNLWDSLTYEGVVEIAEELINLFITNKYDKIEFVYNQFKNAVIQVLQVEQFLPLQIKEDKSNSDINKNINIDYLFEPSKEEILTHLIPKTLKIQLFKAILDSHAAEHGARMTAMQSATDNAESLKQDLVISYNKARQASITNELIEIVSGAQALDN